MKQIIVLLVFTLVTANTLAQNISQKNVPAIVLNAFQLKFSNATGVKWKLEKGNYHVGFDVNNKENGLVISDRGIILRHQQDLYVSEIPKAVLETIKSKVVLFDIINDADRFEEGKKIIYKINLKINGKTHEFEMNERGKLMKYTKELKNSEVPSAITVIIKTKYGYFDIDYAMFKEENGKISYMLKGKINNMNHVFLFDGKTTILKHEQDLRNSEIPIRVMNAAKASYKGFEIRNAKLSEELGKVIYKLNMRRSKENVIVVIDSDGKIL